MYHFREPGENIPEPQWEHSDIQHSGCPLSGPASSAPHLPQDQSTGGSWAQGSIREVSHLEIHNESGNTSGSSPCTSVSCRGRWTYLQRQLWVPAAAALGLCAVFSPFPSLSLSTSSPFPTSSMPLFLNPSNACRLSTTPLFCVLWLLLGCGLYAAFTTRGRARSVPAVSHSAWECWILVTAVGKMPS